MRITKKLLIIVIWLMMIAQPNIAHADVNDFSFDSFDASYDLSLNPGAENRVDMIATEALVALFPNTDQNHGIKRSIPARSYGEFPSLIQVISVTDEKGQPRDFEVSEDGDFVNVVSKPSDGSFVHGRQTYVIKYRQSWVVKNYQSTSGFDEFYWDVNGTGWQQNFGRVSANVRLDSKLSALVAGGKPSCYKGFSGSTDPCDKATLANGGFYFEANDLQPGANLTIDIPFKPGVINTAGPKYLGTTPWYLFWVFSGCLLLVLVWAFWYRRFAIKNEGGEQFIVPQYLPADNPGLLETALIARKTRTLNQALIVELAVKRKLEIESVPNSKNGFILRRTQGSKDENGVLKSLGLDTAGDEVRIGGNADRARQEMAAKSLADIVSTSRKRIDAENYFKPRNLAAPGLTYLLATVVFLGWFLAATSLDEFTSAGFIVAPLLSAVPFTFAFWFLVSKRSYTLKGAEVVNYLSGLKIYIELAEKDRLEFLQSPNGASLKPSEVAGKQALKLIESVLPWAILLGLQKEWSKVLGELYQSTGQPPLIIGSANGMSDLSQLSSALASSLANSQSSGSDGGGFSGGGGGGGGGGGV